ncbi:MAG TPA: ABC transporter ATP-binding protein [Thermomicrobiales bacterium]|nr:ABC transporter ATP-binding protein [Thermomicrobiales bacterium]HRA31554.1 ABC transporter ATP-binding protein [Thermomicrobiales bacterium]
MSLETRLKTTMLSLSLDVGEELMCLIGVSGSGKSAILRSIAGVYQPDNGSIEIGGRQVLSTGLGINLPPAERRVGFVPQSHALFGHLSAGENIAYPLLKQSDLPPAILASRVEQLCDLLNLTDDLQRRPDDLPPLVQLRVALGRALVTDPELLLLDDPFGRLDRETRPVARAEFAELLRRVRVPTLFATVELEEGYEIADRVALIDGGRILQVDAPRTLLLRPVNRRVAELVRSVNVFEGTIARVVDGIATVDTVAGMIRTPRMASVGERVDLVIRPEHVELVSHPKDAAENIIAGEVVEISPHGQVSAVTIRVSAHRVDTTIQAYIANDVVQSSGIVVGGRCLFSLPARAIHTMPISPAS